MDSLGMDETLYIEFVGGEDRVRMLRPVFERLKQIKQREAVANGMVSDRDQHVDNPAWLDLLDEKAIEWLTADENPWDLESMIDQILGGEYDFVELRYHNGTGRLIY